MRVLTHTDIAALDALSNIVSQQAANGVRSEGEARSQFVAERLTHYRRFDITEVEARRLALADLRDKF